MNTLPLRPRVPRQLASLARRHGVPDADGSGETRIGIRLAQVEIAQLVGSSRQRVKLKQMESSATRVRC